LWGGKAADCGVDMKMANDVLRIVTLEGVEVPTKFQIQPGDQGLTYEAEPEKLVQILNDIDSIRREIQERMRRTEAVKQAKSLLMEDAARTEALNKKLAEIGKMMSAIQSRSMTAESELDQAESFRKQSTGGGADGGSRTTHIGAALRVSENVALPWPKQEEVQDSFLIAYETVAPQPGRSQSIEDLEQSGLKGPVVSPPQLVEMPVHTPEEIQSLRQTPVEIGTRAGVSAGIEQISVAEESWKRAEEAAVEARRLFDESRARLEDAANRQERLAAESRAAQDALNAGYQAANDRLAEATQTWQHTDQAAVEAKQLLEAASSRLNRAVSVEEQAAADFHSAQKSLTNAYETASKRLEEAERFWRESDSTGTQVKQMLEQTSTDLAEIRSREETATADLLSARQELTTAYQFAAVAAQRRLDAAEFFKRSAKWAVFASAFSWVAMVWAVWFALRTIAPVWVPCVASTLIVCLAITFGRLGTRED
jgi:hypothetical protein